jgi:hypothetical protein
LQAEGGGPEADVQVYKVEVPVVPRLRVVVALLKDAADYRKIGLKLLWVFVDDCPDFVVHVRCCLAVFFVFGWV